MFSNGLDGWIKRKSSNQSEKNQTKNKESVETAADFEGSLLTKDMPNQKSKYTNLERNIDHMSNETEDTLPNSKKRRIHVKVKERVGEKLPNAKASIKSRTPTSSKASVSSKASTKVEAFTEIEAPTSLEAHESLLPFSKKRFVLTGVFESLSKEDLIYEIKNGLTDYLITGKVLEDQRPICEGRKFKKAMDLSSDKTRKSKIRILNETEFLQYLSDYQKVFSSNLTHLSKSFSEKELSKKPAKLLVASDQDFQERKSDFNHVKKKSELWTDKWKPKTVSDIIGNEEIIKKLITYLNDWFDVIIHKSKKPCLSRSISKSKGYEKVNARAVLLSGPPGVGKTTTARLAAEFCCYHIVEYNASDDRGKAFIDFISDMASGGYSLDHFFNRKTKKPLIIMDEMDGLSSGDRGGTAALVKLIEKAPAPFYVSIKSIVSKCYDLQFRRPTKQAIIRYVCSKLQKESIVADYNAIDLICEKTGNDLRQIINTLQLLAQDGKVNLTFEVISQKLYQSSKDLQVMDTAFDVARKLLNHSNSSKMSFNEKFYGYFTDYDLLPLMISENYLASYQNKIKKELSTENNFAPIVEASRCISFSDILNKKCRRNNQWSLLNDIGLFSVVVPSCTTSGFIPFPAFPSWLGKNSTATKNRRLLYELQTSMTKVTSTSPNSMQISGYLETIFYKITNYLLTRDNTELPQNIKLAAKLIMAYNISKDQFIEGYSCLKLKSQTNYYESVESRVKRSFTTESNLKSVKLTPFKTSKDIFGLKTAKSEPFDTENTLKEDCDLADISSHSDSSCVDILIKNKNKSNNKTKEKEVTTKVRK